MSLKEMPLGEERLVRQILTEDEELNGFLFSLGCYVGQPITVVSRRRTTITVAIKNGRYCIDNSLAALIIV